MYICIESKEDKILLDSRHLIDLQLTSDNDNTNNENTSNFEKSWYILAHATDNREMVFGISKRKEDARKMFDGIKQALISGQKTYLIGVEE